MIYVPAPFAADAILEAADAGIRVIVCITEGIPVLRHAAGQGAPWRAPASVLIGPNCPGIITPGAVQDRHHARQHPSARAGRHRLALRHPDLRGGLPDHPGRLGQSTCIGIGGDPIQAWTSSTVWRCSRQDPADRGVIMVGEIGGSAEEEAARVHPGPRDKPVVAYIAGVTAPAGKRMGHAGAIITGGKGTAAGQVCRAGGGRGRHRRSPARMGAGMAKCCAERSAPRARLDSRLRYGDDPGCRYAMRQPADRTLFPAARRRSWPSPNPGSHRSEPLDRARGRDAARPTLRAPTRWSFPNWP